MLNSDNSSAIQTLTDGGTANGSTAHADARAFAFDASGRLIMVGDGGVYVRTNPQGTDGVWTGLNSSTLQLREAYAIAYDAISKRLVVAAQDTGVAYQANRGGTLFTAIGQGDGVNAVVNDKTLVRPQRHLHDLAKSGTAAAAHGRRPGAHRRHHDLRHDQGLGKRVSASHPTISPNRPIPAGPSTRCPSAARSC